jgi:hypothetical protein
MAKTVSEAHDRLPRFTQERCAVIIYAPGLLRIGGAAYFVWAYPPNLESELDFGPPSGSKWTIFSGRVPVVQMQVLLTVSFNLWFCRKFSFTTL